MWKMKEHIKGIKMDVNYPHGRFQKETKFNKFLPYYDEKFKEAEEHFAAIKSGLANSVIMNELCPSLQIWTLELKRYIEMYGYMFTKTDHVNFVQFFTEFICIPGIELKLMESVCSVLLTLLRKPKLLCPEDVEIEWRPFYDIYVDLKYKQRVLPTNRTPIGFVAVFEPLIILTRNYFSVNAAKEILTELKPLLSCDATVKRSLECFNLFMPTQFSIAIHEEEFFKLWIDEMLSGWLNIDISIDCESIFVEILSRLAYDNIGYVKFTHIMPRLCTKILCSFGLKVTFYGLKTDQYISNDAYCNSEGDAAFWIVSALGRNNKVQEYISQLLLIVQQYMNNSTDTDSQEKMYNFADSLAFAVCHRVHKERYRKNDWRQSVPEDWKLTNHQIDGFVSSILSCVLSGIYSKENSSWPVNCLRYLSHLSPNIVVAAVLEKIYPALESASQSSQYLTQSLSALVSIIVPLSREKDANSCRNHLFRLLAVLLSCMDSCDVANITQIFIALTSIFQLVPIVDCSNAIPVRANLTEEEEKLCSTTASFENIFHTLMDKIFLFLNSLPPVADSDVKEQENELTVHNFYLFHSSLNNCSQKIHQLVVDRLFSYVSTADIRILDANVSKLDLVATMCNLAVRTDQSRMYFRKFLLFFTQEIKKYPLSDDQSIYKVVCYTTVCSKLFMQVNNIYLYKNEIWELLNLLLPFKQKEVYSKLSNILNKILYSLCKVYISEDTSSSSHFGENFAHYFPIQHWGQACNMDGLYFNWHVPTSDDIEFVKELHQVFIFDELKHIENVESLSKNELLKVLTLMEACITTSFNLFIPLHGELQNLVNSRVSSPQLARFTHVDCCYLQFKGMNIRNLIFHRLHPLVGFLLTHQEYDVKCLSLICNIFHCLLVRRYTNQADFNNFEQIVNYFKLSLSDTVQERNLFVHTMFRYKILLQHYKLEAEDSRDAYYITENHLSIVDDLIRLSTCQFKEVYESAQGALYHFMNDYPLAYQCVFQSIISLLNKNSKMENDMLKGVIRLLGMAENRKPYIICNNYNLLAKLWPLLIKVQHSGDGSIIELMQQFRTSIFDNFNSFPMHVPISTKVAQLAAKLLDPTYSKRSETPITSFQITNNIDLVLGDLHENHCKRAYYQLIQILVDLTDDRYLHPCQLGMVYSFLQMLIRFDADFPQSAIKIFSKAAAARQDNGNVIQRKGALFVLSAFYKSRNNHT